MDPVKQWISNILDQDTLFPKYGGITVVLCQFVKQLTHIQWLPTPAFNYIAETIQFQPYYPATLVAVSLAICTGTKAPRWQDLARRLQQLFWAGTVWAGVCFSTCTIVYRNGESGQADSHQPDGIVIVGKGACSLPILCLTHTLRYRTYLFFAQMLRAIILHTLFDESHPILRSKPH